MKKCWFLLLVVLMLFTACSTAQEVPETTTTPTVPTEPPMVDVGGTEFAPEVSELKLAATAYDLEQLVSAASSLKQVTYIDLGQTELTCEQMDRLQKAYPKAEIDYTVAFLGQELTRDTQTLDAAAMTPDQTEELLRVISLMPQIQEINFVREDGTCAYAVEDIAQLDKVRAALPEAYLRVSFELFGQTVTSEDERIEYYLVEIGNEGVETVRAVLPYLKSCTYLLMEGCGVDNEVMAQLRDDFPDTKVVWRVWLVEEDYNSKLFLRCGSYLTDTHRIRTTYVNDENSHVLNYCTETKYVDVGHVWQISQCDFLSYMPDLEVCILAITSITDIAPLANHEKLEYLELFTTDVKDLSPLASCPNLAHLNIADMPYVEDISPLYGLTKLERLRMVVSPKIPQEQKDEIEKLLPNCTILKGGDFPTTGKWRWAGPVKGGEKVPRYELLCEQMEYAIDGMEYGIP